MKKIISLFLISILIISMVSCKQVEDKCKPGEHGTLEWVVVKDSTCNTLGQKNQICSKCKEVITTSVIQYKEHK